MRIGCVREIKNNEYRVGLTPDNVKGYVNAGHQVFVERGEREKVPDFPRKSMKKRAR